MRPENFLCCILACSNEKIKGLNAKFRGKNNSTNVLSFPSTSKICEVTSSPNFETNVDPFELGDIAIAYEICKQEADFSKIDFEHYVYHLIIHSVLHLLGYDHVDEKNAIKMEKIDNHPEKMKENNGECIIEATQQNKNNDNAENQLKTTIY